MIALVVEFEMLNVEVTLATTWETVIVFVRVAVDVMVEVQEVVVVSARARSGSMAAESSVEILILYSSCRSISD